MRIVRKPLPTIPDSFLAGLPLLSLVVANYPVEHLGWKFVVLLLGDVSCFEGALLGFSAAPAVVAFI